jgi:hypothetical protein
VGLRAATTGVKFWTGSPSTLGKKVASGLVWRFGTFDNLACFKDGFGDGGSFLDVGGHRFYVAKPFPKEVTDVLDPLGDGGSSCSESSDLGAMVEVMALGDEEGGNSPRPACPPLEHLLPQEQNAPLLEQDGSDIAVVDLRSPLDHVIDPVQVAEALERTRLVLLNKVAEDEDTRPRMSTTLREFYDVHGDALDELAHGRQRGRGLTAAVLARSSGRRRQAKARGGADRAVMLRAATLKAAAPGRLVEMASYIKSRC